MVSFRSPFQLLEKIIRHMPKGERFLVLLLAAVMVASFLRLVLPSFAELPKTLGSTVYAEGLVGSPRLLNPVFVDFNEADRDVSRLIFSGLLKYDPVQQNFIPDLAENIQRSNDNLAYLITLKKNIVWHDGEPVTADDILFTFRKIIQDPGFKNPILQSAFQEVVLQKIDDYTVSFTLEQPNSYFISYLTTGLLPFHQLKEAAVSELERHSFNKKPIGTGPYFLSNAITPGSTTSLLLQRFEKYYGEKPSFEFVRFSFYPDSKKLIASKNKINVIAKISSTAWKENEDNRFLASAYHLPEYVGLFFNLERPNIEKKKVRQALMKSVDKQGISRLLESIVPIDTIGLRTIPDEWIHQFDSEAALQALKDLGYRNGEDGLLKDGKGNLLEFSLLAERFPKNATLEQRTTVLVDFIKNSWQNLGIKVRVVREDGRNFTQLLQDREYDVVLAGHRLGYNTDAFAFWHSSQRNKTGLNFSQLKSFRIDSLLEDLRLTFDGKKKRQKLEELEKLLADETAALFLFTPEYKMLVDRKIQGLTPDHLLLTSDRFANFSQVKSEK